MCFGEAEADAVDGSIRGGDGHRGILRVPRVPNAVSNVFECCLGELYVVFVLRAQLVGEFLYLGSTEVDDGILSEVGIWAQRVQQHEGRLVPRPFCQDRLRSFLRLAPVGGPGAAHADVLPGHTRRVSIYSWPDDRYKQLAERARNTWAATTEALPIGTQITGQIIGRQPFGVFIRIDDHPDASGLAEITAMPRNLELPTLDTRVAAEVIWHTEHNHQIKLRLDTWNNNTWGSAPDPGTASGGGARYSRQ